MYIATDFVILNGGTSDLMPIKSGFFRTIKEISEYESVIENYYQNFHDDPIKVFVHYKIPIAEHIDHNKKMVGG